VIERWSASGLNARYAKTARGIVPRLSTSNSPEVRVFVGAEQSELISGLDTLTTGKRKAHDRTSKD